MRNKKSTIKTFGELIKYKRQIRHMSQYNLAMLLDIDVSTISRWERNQSIPDSTSILLISKIFNLPSHHLKVILINPLNLSIPKSELRKSDLSFEKYCWFKYFLVGFLMISIFLRINLSKGINDPLNSVTSRIVFSLIITISLLFFLILLFSAKLKERVLYYIIQKVELTMDNYNEKGLKGITKLFDFFIGVILILLIILLIFII